MGPHPPQPWRRPAAWHGLARHCQRLSDHRHRHDRRHGRVLPDQLSAGQPDAGPLAVAGPSRAFCWLADRRRLGVAGGDSGRLWLAWRYRCGACHAGAGPRHRHHGATAPPVHAGLFRVRGLGRHRDRRRQLDGQSAPSPGPPCSAPPCKPPWRLRGPCAADPHSPVFLSLCLRRRDGVWNFGFRNGFLSPWLRKVMRIGTPGRSK